MKELKELKALQELKAAKETGILPAARATCDRCRRPEVVCYCAHLPLLPTRTRLLMLQHPRESRVGIGTARMAHLSLPSSVLRIGVNFAADPVVAATLAAAPPSYLLFPGEQARDIRELPRDQPISLVVVDGTWSQARTLVRANPALAALPRIAFVPQRPSDYRIRKEPADFCVSTIEALVEVLNVLEPERAPFDALLEPFRVMVDRQQWFQNEVRSSRHARLLGRPRRPPGPSLGERLAAAWPHLVCIQGEANGWPARHPERQPAELIHFAASRPATGERFEALVAPRRPMAPCTPQHVDLTAERLTGAGTIDQLRESWQAFARPDDVLVQWGSFHTNLMRDEGVSLSGRRIDLRGELSQTLRRRCETLEDCVARLGAPVAPLGIDGRCGRRLAALQALLRSVAQIS